MSGKLVLIFMTIMLVLALAGCGQKETPEQKLTAFKQAHAAIYDAWQASTMQDLQDRLSKGMVDPFLNEQIEQQSAVMKMRVVQNEQHGVRSIDYKEMKIVEDGSRDFTVAVDWVVRGYRDHGDVHEANFPFKKKFHVVKVDGVWKIDKMMDF